MLLCLLGLYVFLYFLWNFDTVSIRTYTHARTHDYLPFPFIVRLESSGVSRALTHFNEQMIRVHYMVWYIYMRQNQCSLSNIHILGKCIVLLLLLLIFNDQPENPIMKNWCGLWTHNDGGGGDGGDGCSRGGEVLMRTTTHNHETFFYHPAEIERNSNSFLSTSTIYVPASKMPLDVEWNNLLFHRRVTLREPLR